MTKHILITGATSGIGEELAIFYASPARTLTICGRDQQRLDQIVAKCKERGATVYPEIIDVSDRDAMKKWILQADETMPIDLVYANAGVGLTETGYDAAEKTFAINMDGVVNTIHPILPRMEQRGEGQVVLISSMAGYAGLPSAPAYSASKNFVRAYGEALRGKLADKGVKVNVVCPGFVKSRLTDQNKFKMPFFMETDKAVSIITNGVHTNKGRIAFPWQMVASMKFLSMLPYPLYELIVKKLPNKN